MNQNSRRINAFFILFFLFLFLSMPLFAQQALTQLNSFAETIRDIMTSNLVRTILVIALIGCFIAFAVNKDSQRVKNSSIAIAISCAVIMSASMIIGLIWVD